MTALHHVVENQDAGEIYMAVVTNQDAVDEVYMAVVTNQDAVEEVYMGAVNQDVVDEFWPFRVPYAIT